MHIDIADIATNEKKKLNGFKVLGVFPFYLRYISTGTHIKLCAIKHKIQSISKEPSVSDFYDSEIQRISIPLINEYIITALINDRAFAWFFRLLLKRKIKQCGHYHILNLYATIQKLDEPAFFLSYWKWLNIKDTTLLKEVKQY